MTTLNRHALVAATAALAVAGALTLVAQDVGATPTGPVAHAVPTGDAMLVAAADMFCAVVSGS